MSVTFSTSTGSNVVTTTIVGHGALDNAYVTFSGSEAVGGIPASEINAEHSITNVTANSFTITVTTNATSTVPSGGGSNIVAEFQVNPGLDTSVAGTGWGAGTWSRGTWGSGADLTVVSDILRLWTHDNFGEDLLLNIRDGGIYYWDKSGGFDNRAVAISALPGADASTPTLAKKVFVSDRDRHVIALGADPVGNIGTQDPLLIRFSDQESLTTWTPTAENSAGDLVISAGSEIITGIETRQQILVFTDVSLHAMQFLGAPFTFGIGLISENITIMGPNAAIAVDDTVYWMGQEEFYVYSGQVQKLPCTVRDFVFSDFNLAQREKAIASLNSSFGEVWWFYPSESSDNNDRYVVYNYEQNVWYYGILPRTAWIDRGINDNPVAASTDGYLYLHERGFDDGSTVPASAMDAYIESSQADIQDGNDFVFIRRLIPDLTFRDSTAENPFATFTLKARNFPGGAYLQSNAKTVTKTASVPVEQFTDQVNVRLRGRSFAIRVESDATGVGWRLGSPRIDVRPDGER